MRRTCHPITCVRLHVDCLTHSERALRFVLDTVGAERVVLGTDYPADMGIAHPRQWIEAGTTVSTEEKPLILGSNASKLIKVPTAS